MEHEHEGDMRVRSYYSRTLVCLIQLFIFLCGSILNTTVHKNRSRSILHHEQFLIVL